MEIEYIHQLILKCTQQIKINNNIIFMNKIFLLAPSDFQKKGFWEYYGVDDWKIAFPVGLLIAFPLYNSGVSTYHLYFKYNFLKV